MDVNDRQVTIESEPGEPRPTSVLVHLSGSRRGHSHRLSGNEIKIGTGAGMDLVPAERARELLSAVRPRP